MNDQRDSSNNDSRYPALKHIRPANPPIDFARIADATESVIDTAGDNAPIQAINRKYSRSQFVNPMGSAQSLTGRRSTSEESRFAGNCGRLNWGFVDASGTDEMAAALV